MLPIMYNFYMLYISFIYMYVTCICMYSVHVWCCHLATWNMPFSLVWQKLSSFRLAVKFSIFDMQQKNHSRCYTCIGKRFLLICLPL